MSTASDVVTTTADHVDDVIRQAADVQPELAAQSPAQRAGWLRELGLALEQDRDELCDLAEAEAHLSRSRLENELSRTVFQFGFIADHIETGQHLGLAIDSPDPAWPPGPRPDLRRMQVPIGPVLVFEASNFPFAFGAAGTDTAAALAAGCPVVLKAHPAHPELTARIDRSIGRFLDRRGLPTATFGTIYGEDAGRRALLHPRIAAASFTGSERGGRALYDLAASRPRPIPFYAEMGSINPVFITERAMEQRAAQIWPDYVSSLATHAGQLCTKPGVLIVPRKALAASPLPALIADWPANTMLTPQIAAGFRAGLGRVQQAVGMSELASSSEPGGPVVLTITAADVLADPDAVLTEMFGPASVVITYDDPAQMLELAQELDGQLTASLHLAENDDAVQLLGALTEVAGRVIVNGWPTGVSVAHAMNHGGPYPATSHTTTSVGAHSVDRFLRSVSYQSVPARLLPPALADDNPWHLDRTVDGVWKPHAHRRQETS